MYCLRHLRCGPTISSTASATSSTPHGEPASTLTPCFRVGLERLSIAMTAPAQRPSQPNLPNQTPQNNHRQEIVIRKRYRKLLKKKKKKDIGKHSLSPTLLFRSNSSHTKKIKKTKKKKCFRRKTKLKNQIKLFIKLR